MRSCQSTKWGKPRRIDHKRLWDRYRMPAGVIYPPYLRQFDAAHPWPRGDVAFMPKAEELMEREPLSAPTLPARVIVKVLRAEPEYWERVARNIAPTTPDQVALLALCREGAAADYTFEIACTSADAQDIEDAYYLEPERDGPPDAPACEPLPFSRFFEEVPPCQQFPSMRSS